jgi:diaminohydroxyphosphoribosylaminopyrimidine deaminase/5-amino-6-(5-phosphoribosylamino)uracil reductase
MRAALAYAAGAVGSTSPNPSVACLLVKNGVLIARGRTQPGGRPHAETEALQQAGSAALGATAYVTLEPCSHHGMTSPCTDALIAAGVARVVVACPDPNPKVNGGGLAALRAAGIAVTTDVCRTEAQTLNAPFFHYLRTGLPFVSVKVAVSLDGRIALANGMSQWISSPQSRALVQQWRAQADALLTTAATAQRDNARLTVRLPGVLRPPVRVLLDRRLTTPADAAIFSGQSVQPTWVFTSRKGSSPGYRTVQVPEHENKMNIKSVLAVLVDFGVRHVLIEAGQGLLTHLWQENLWNRWLHVAAPNYLGGDSLGVLGALHLTTLPPLGQQDTVTEFWNERPLA